MAIDLTGGLDVSREHVFPRRPDHPEMRDAVNMWVSDDRGVLGLPRFAVEALASKWDAHDLSVNIAFPNGRVLSVRASGPTHSPTGPENLPTVLGAGPLVFRCVEPFRLWVASFKGEAAEMTTLDQVNGALPGKGPAVNVEFQIEARMAAPPWIQGQLSSTAAAQLRSSVEGNFMGGDRYEQLFRAKGTLRIGTEVHAFTGSGLRIRRQGIRKIEGFWGHCWQSALFPSGRGFGFITYPPRPDGTPSYNEGYIFEGDGALIPARVIQAPWLSKLSAAGLPRDSLRAALPFGREPSDLPRDSLRVALPFGREPSGQDVSVVLESRAGRMTIEGETIVSTFAMGRPEMPPDFPVLQQAGARYRWNGEETYGMIERSSPKDKVTR